VSIEIWSWWSERRGSEYVEEIVGGVCVCGSPYETPSKCSLWLWLVGGAPEMEERRARKTAKEKETEAVYL
jgi:hypothetical protein